MVGPKLDSRTYTTLILTAIALLLAMNLVKAQYGSTPDVPYKTESGSGAEIAAATREVAAANNRIADSLEKVAEAVGRVKLTAPAAASTSVATEATPTGAEGTSASPSSESGVVFDMK